MLTLVIMLISGEKPIT